MADIRRSKAGPKVRLTDEEVTLLTRLVDDIDTLLAGDTGDADTLLAGDTGDADTLLAGDTGDADTLLAGDTGDADTLLAGDTDDAEPGAVAPSTSSSSRAGTDPLVELTGLDVAAADNVEPPSDPALRRLLPDAYRDDAEAAAEFRRYTDQSLRGAKRADATMVRQGLASIAVMGERVLDDEQTQAWLRFITDARLVLASRLGIETAADADRLEMLDDDDPRRMAYAVYEWLLSILGRLLEAIDAA